MTEAQQEVAEAHMQLYSEEADTSLELVNRVQGVLDSRRVLPTEVEASVPELDETVPGMSTAAQHEDMISQLQSFLE